MGCYSRVMLYVAWRDARLWYRHCAADPVSLLAESRPGEDAKPLRLARFLPMDHKNDRNINAAINDLFSAGRASPRLGPRESVASSSELRVGFLGCG